MDNVCPVCGNVVQSGSTSCEMCGFKLVGSTQEFAAITPENLGEMEHEKPQGCQLRVLRGPQLGTVYPLTNDVATIGRNPHCDIFLNDMTVSRSHATLSRTSTSYRIVDDNSFNGVWVNGNNVSTAILKSGDQLQIGAFHLVFERA